MIKTRQGHKLSRDSITYAKAVKSRQCRLSCLFLFRVHFVSKVLSVLYFLTVLGFRYVLLHLVFSNFLSLLPVCCCTCSQTTAE